MSRFRSPPFSDRRHDGMRRPAAVRLRCRRECGLLAGLALYVLSGQAAAQQTLTSQMTVTATVQASCMVTATNLVFGIYTGVQNDNTATLTVTCSTSTPYYVNLGNGLHQDGSYYPRMIGPGGIMLGYRLYQNAARSIEWRSTYNYDGQAGTGTGGAQTLTVYGRLLAAQYGTPGAYADTITATVTY